MAPRKARGIPKAALSIALDIITVSGFLAAVGFVGGIECGSLGLLDGALRAFVSLAVSGAASLAGNSFGG